MKSPKIFFLAFFDKIKSMILYTSATRNADAIILQAYQDALTQHNSTQTNEPQKHVVQSQQHINARRAYERAYHTRTKHLNEKYIKHK